MKDSPSGKNSLFVKIILSLNILAAFFLVLSVLASYISPGMIWILGIFGYLFPYLVFINLLFIFYWLFRKWKYAIISGMVIIIGYKSLLATIQFHFHSSVPLPTEKNIRILSFNVRLFDVYQWDGTNGRETRRNIFFMLKEESPDIFCLQEFFTSDYLHFNNDIKLKRFLSDTIKGRNYQSHIEIVDKQPVDGQFGAATFSIYPIVGKGKIIFDEASFNVCLWTDLLIEQDTVRVFNLHLQSIRFAPEDYKFVKNITNEKEEEEISGSKKILRRLKKAFIRRSHQADIVYDEIRKSPYTVIICGDFNDPPSSYTYQKISQNMEDSFVESGWGFAKSYIGAFPSFRIDYILHDKSFSASNFRTIQKKYSDHFPVATTLTRKIQSR